MEGLNQVGNNEEESIKKPISEVLAKAKTILDLKTIGLIIQNNAPEISTGEKKVLEILFWEKCHDIFVPQKDLDEIVNKTMEALGSKARIFAQEKRKLEDEDLEDLFD